MEPLEVALGDMPSSKVNFPTIEGSSTKTVVAGVTSHMKTVPAATVSNGVTTVATSAPLGNDRKNSTINFVHILCFLSLTLNLFCRNFSVDLSRYGAISRGSNCSHRIGQCGGRRPLL